MKNRSPRSSRTSMQLPGFAKFGRSVPTRWAMNVACFLASRLDAQSCPNTSRAGISPTKSKKNLCMINVTNPRSMRSYQQRVLRDPRMIGIGELIAQGLYFLGFLHEWRNRETPCGFRERRPDGVYQEKRLSAAIDDAENQRHQSESCDRAGKCDVGRGRICEARQ